MQGFGLKKHVRPALRSLAARVPDAARRAAARVGKGRKKGGRCYASRAVSPIVSLISESSTSLLTMA